MRSHIRTVAVVVLALALLGLFLRNVDFSGVFREIAHAQPGWLLLSLTTMVLNLVIRAWRWQFLLEPLGKASFANSFRATAVGFAARSFLPAAAGELVRPYFLSRREPMSATGAFATIVIERLLDMITVLVLLASYVFVFGRDLSDVNPAAVAAVKWAGASAGAISIAALVVLFVMAGNPARLAAMFQRLEQVVPSALAGLIARIAEKFATGLGAIRRPGQVVATLVCVDSAVAVHRARHLGGGRGVPPRRAVYRVVSHHRAADDRHRHPDARIGRRVSRGIPPRRHRLLRRAGRCGGRRRHRAARDVDRLAIASSASSSPRRKA